MNRVIAEKGRIALARDVERFPHFTAPAGSTGTITEVLPDRFTVKMDDHIPGCEEWDNEIVWEGEGSALTDEFNADTVELKP